MGIMMNHEGAEGGGGGGTSVADAVHAALEGESAEV